MNETEFRKLVGLERVVVSQFILDRERFKECENRSGAEYAVTTLDEVLLVLIYLRHFIVDSLLGAIFLISQKTTYNTRHRMVDWFYSLLGVDISMETPQYRKENGCMLYYDLHTFGVDGSEQPVEAAAKDPWKNFRYYSPKSGMHSINILVVIALNGKILWISPAFPGSNSDIVILKKPETLQQWHPLLEEDEFGLGDLGFEGCSSLRINVPPARSNPFYKYFAHFRVTVENTFERIKNWRCCKDAVRDKLVDENNLLEQHHKRWTIIGAFINRYGL
jgi:hypothetical protein